MSEFDYGPPKFCVDCRTCGSIMTVIDVETYEQCGLTEEERLSVKEFLDKHEGHNVKTGAAQFAVLPKAEA